MAARAVPGAGAADRLRDAEVGDDGGALSKEHVLRLDVAMHHALTVRVRERLGDVAQNGNDVVQRKQPVSIEPRTERLAINERHRVVEQLATDRRGEQRHDVRMLEARRQLDLTTKTLGADPLRELGCEDLHDDASAQRPLFGKKNARHSTTAELPLDGVDVADGLVELGLKGRDRVTRTAEGYFEDRMRSTYRPRYAGISTRLRRGPMTPAERTPLVRRGLWLNYLTIGYNAVEAVVSLVAGLIAGSVALVGFGFDSVIELTASGAAQWRLRVDVDVERREAVERLTLRIVGWCFLALAAYVTYESAETLWRRERPDRSIVGILILAASVIVMPVLARAKRRVATAMSSRVLASEATQTSLCAYLSAIALAGVALNAALGWWWADPIAALVMVPIIVREGIEGVRAERCADDCC